MNNAGTLTLVLGGARSGKSAYAEQLARDSDLKRIYLATSQAFDDEMRARIDKHIEDRGDTWETVEEPTRIAHILSRKAASDSVILVDCLTLWISNLMMEEQSIEDAALEFLDTLSNLKGPVILVSNEVGQGIVPDNNMARDFRDYAGRLHQQIAAIADQVYFVTAGLPQKLK